jgi:RimJ/RimL family protein N-acetyltransferase
MGEPHVVTLRATRAEDLDALFRFEQNEAAVHMAAFTRPDPYDRAAFDAHWRRIMDDPRTDTRTVRADGVVVGSVGRWFEDDTAEITYWIDPAHWGEGIATRAVRLLLDSLRERPVRARVAADNAASIAVLEKLGFRQVGTARGYANARGTEIEERIYRLD